MQVATIIPVVGTGEVPVNGESGYVTVDMIKRRVPDYMERLWFVSGPPPMVQGVKKSLRSLGVPRRQIIEDFFPGLA